MAIVARNLEGINAVAVSPAQRLALPEPQHVFALFPGAASKGSRLLDDTALHMRAFTFPELSLQLIFEPTRIRLEATTPHKPTELRLGEILHTVEKTIFPKNTFERHGFNYDIAYQYDAVIPQRALWERFVSKDVLENMTHFGWQMTLQKGKGEQKETYFFKVVSPLELRVLANIEIDHKHEEFDAQRKFEECYTSSQEIVNHLTFS